MLEHLESLRTALSSDSELGKRLQLVAPVLAATIAGRNVSPLAIARRNTASCNFKVSNGLLLNASHKELNELQRTITVMHTASGDQAGTLEHLWELGSSWCAELPVGLVCNCTDFEKHIFKAEIHAEQPLPRIAAL